MISSTHSIIYGEHKRCRWERNFLLYLVSLFGLFSSTFLGVKSKFPCFALDFSVFPLFRFSVLCFLSFSMSSCLLRWPFFWSIWLKKFGKRTEFLKGTQFCYKSSEFDFLPYPETDAGPVFVNSENWLQFLWVLSLLKSVILLSFLCLS